MAVAMSLWSFQQYPEDDPIKFLGGVDDLTYSDEELGMDPFGGDIDELEPQPGRLSGDELEPQPGEDNLFGDVEIEDNPFEVDISEEED